MDVLSDAIGVMRTGRPAANRLRAGRAWCYRLSAYHGAGFHVLLRGTAWLLPDGGGAPVALGVGDVVLLPHGHAHLLADSPRPGAVVPFERAVGDPAGPVEFLCGKYRLDRSRAHPLLSGLPEVVHIPARVGAHPELRAAVDLLGAEVVADRPGQDAVLAGLLDLLLVYLVRAWLTEGAPARLDSGWPAALRDPELLAALTALHAEPAVPWRVDTLAARVGLSRATLARRFTTLIGQSPMSYLTWWRMTIAARLLRETDLSLDAIARQVGYATGYAFSPAFKRAHHLAPGAYRAAGGRARAESATSTESVESAQFATVSAGAAAAGRVAAQAHGRAGRDHQPGGDRAEGQRDHADQADDQQQDQGGHPSTGRPPVAEELIE